jgi:hypothetical protein
MASLYKVCMKSAQAPREMSSPCLARKVRVVKFSKVCLLSYTTLPSTSATVSGTSVTRSAIYFNQSRRPCQLAVAVVFTWREDAAAVV